MTRWRVRLVYGLIAAVAGGHLAAILTGREWWPFSPYPMYALTKRDYALSTFRLYGVLEGDAPGEVPLLAREHIWPFDQSRLRVALGRLSSAMDGDICHIFWVPWARVGSGLAARLPRRALTRWWPGGAR